MKIYNDIVIEPREKRRLLTVFAVGTLGLIAVGILLFNQYQQLVLKPAGVRDTYDVLLQTREVFSHLQDIETGQRGYLLTGDKAFLEPYQKASQTIDEQFAILRQKVQDNPQRLKQLEELSEVVGQQRRLLQKQIRDRDKTVKNRILTAVEAETGKAIMDHVRSVVDRMIEDEKNILAERIERSQQNRDKYARLLLVGVLLALLALVVTNGVVVQTSMRRRNVEVALQRTREFSSIILDNSPDCIKLISPEGKLLSLNAGGCQLLEIDDVATCMNAPWLEFWKGQHQVMAARAFEEAKRGRVSRFEGECATVKGNMRWWEVVIAPIKNEDGKVEQLLCISRDITKRYLQEQTVRESEAHFRQMADTLPHMLWVARADGFREYFNKRWYEYTGMPEGEINGWQKRVHPEDHDMLIKHWDHCLATGEPYEIEYRLRRADGVYLWTLGRALPKRDESGKVIRWFGTSTVIEDQKRVEAELRDARDLAERANASKSEFLANMSHEIRTPMNAVVGLSNLLSKSNLSDEKRREFIHTIQLSAQQLMDLINDLLDVTKLEGAHVELEKIPFNMAELMEEIISVMGVKAKERKVELVVKYSPEMNSNFLGDPLRLRQVLMNLVSNSIKFTSKGTVTLQVDHCHNEASGAWDICFDVIDTGIGIPANKLETIFSKFSQADTTITRKYGGTGLGLSICKTLVELMKGTIKVVSTEGLGSKFTVMIPFMRTDGDAIVLKNRRPKHGASKKVHSGPAERQPLVLLVEDYKANVLVATHTIEDCGYSWELAEDGLEAIAKAKSGRYDAILMDVQMPYMDGMTATRHIRDWEIQEGRKRTPILGITAYSMEGDRDRCIDAGMDDYLSKPFNPDDLKEKMRKLAKAA